MSSVSERLAMFQKGGALSNKPTTNATAPSISSSIPQSPPKSTGNLRPSSPPPAPSMVSASTAAQMIPSAQSPPKNSPFTPTNNVVSDKPMTMTSPSSPPKTPGTLPFRPMTVTSSPTQTPLVPTPTPMSFQGTPLKVSPFNAPIAPSMTTAPASPKGPAPASPRSFAPVAQLTSPSSPPSSVPPTSPKVSTAPLLAVKPNTNSSPSSSTPMISGEKLNQYGFPVIGRDSTCPPPQHFTDFTSSYSDWKENLPFIKSNLCLFDWKSFSFLVPTDNPWSPTDWTKDNSTWNAESFEDNAKEGFVSSCVWPVCRTLKGKFEEFRDSQDEKGDEIVNGLNLRKRIAKMGEDQINGIHILATPSTAPNFSLTYNAIKTGKDNTMSCLATDRQTFSGMGKSITEYRYVVEHIPKDKLLRVHFNPKMAPYNQTSECCNVYTEITHLMDNYLNPKNSGPSIQSLFPEAKIEVKAKFVSSSPPVQYSKETLLAIKDCENKHCNLTGCSLDEKNVYPRVWSNTLLMQSTDKRIPGMKLYCDIQSFRVPGGRTYHMDEFVKTWEVTMGNTSNFSTFAKLFTSELVKANICHVFLLKSCVESDEDFYDKQCKDRYGHGRDTDELYFWPDITRLSKEKVIEWVTPCYLGFNASSIHLEEMMLKHIPYYQFEGSQRPDVKLGISFDGLPLMTVERWFFQYDKEDVRQGFNILKDWNIVELMDFKKAGHIIRIDWASFLKNLPQRTRTVHEEGWKEGWIGSGKYAVYGKKEYVNEDRKYDIPRPFDIVMGYILSFVKVLWSESVKNKRLQKGFTVSFKCDPNIRCKDFVCSPNGAASPLTSLVVSLPSEICDKLSPTQISSDIHEVFNGESDRVAAEKKREEEKKRSDEASAKAQLAQKLRDEEYKQEKDRLEAADKAMRKKLEEDDAKKLAESKAKKMKEEKDNKDREDAYNKKKEAVKNLKKFQIGTYSISDQKGCEHALSNTKHSLEEAEQQAIRSVQQVEANLLSAQTNLASAISRIDVQIVTMKANIFATFEEFKVKFPAGGEAMWTSMNSSYGMAITNMETQKNTLPNAYGLSRIEADVQREKDTHKRNIEVMKKQIGEMEEALQYYKENPIPQ